MKKYLSLLPLFGLFFLLVVTNYIPGTWLSGWDNLHLEFNFAVNIQRSFFAVWQEYQGLGLLGGMAHASDLPRQLFLWITSIILPASTIRYFYHFLMLLLGPLGVYFLIRSVILVREPLAAASRIKSDSGVALNLPNVLPRMTPLLGSIFYLLNLATIQTFYVPYEAFSAHFESLPWLLFATILYFQNYTKKTTLFLVGILLLSSPAAYVPTLFIVFIIVTVLLLPFLHSSFVPFTGLKFYTIIFLVNAFWLLPFLYFTFTNAHVAVDAKINQMTTETIFLQNKEFGNITDAMLLKGFWFNNVDPNKNGIYAYMIQPWRVYLANPFIQTIGYALFAVVLLGVVVAIKTKKPLLLGFVFLFLFSVTMLATSTIPFSWFDIVFRKIPLFNQAFRFPFTKFSILAALTYSIFFAIGIEQLQKMVSKFSIFNFQFSIKTSNFKFQIIPIVSMFLLIIFTFPAFQGHLFYEKDRLNIPKEYFALFDFFKKQDPNTRIANFPQYQFWGWSYYRWGYGGSGFLWYGIKQPILDRAFDVWSKTDENYYFELSHALYSKNSTLFTHVLNKYQATWLLVDQSVINPSGPKALFYTELLSMIKDIPTVKKVATFGHITIYTFALQNKPKDFVSLFKELPYVNGYEWGEQDTGFTDHKNYITVQNKETPSQSSFYPFRSLFSNKRQADLGFSVSNGYEDLTFSSAIPQVEKNTTLTIPSLLKADLIPIDIVVRKEKTQTLLIIKITTPEVFVDTNKIWGTTIEKPLFAILPGASFPLELDVNGLAHYTILDQNAYVQRTFIATKKDNVFVLRDKKGPAIQTQTVPPSFLDSMGELNESPIYLGKIKPNSHIVVKIQKINDGYIGTTIKPTMFPKAKNCDNFRTGTVSSAVTQDLLTLSAINATACTSIDLNDLDHREGYAIFVPNTNISGRSLHFWLLNNKEEFSPIDTYLATGKSLNTFIFAPQDSFGKGYSMHLDNISIGSDVTKNAVGEISIYPLPYAFLTNILVTNQTIKNPLDLTKNIQVIHPNESLYVVTVPTKNIPSTLVLSQSFDPGWKAYIVESGKLKDESYFSIFNSQFSTLFPFLFGEELKNHVLVNNWENGWVLQESSVKSQASRVVLIFLPQYLEYFGFVLLLGLCGWFGINWIREKRK